MRGLPQDFDGWGVPGWGWDQMRPCFRAIEDGEEGRPPLGVTPHPGGDPLCDAALAAAQALGVPQVDDINRATGPAVAYQPRSITAGRRRDGSTFLSAGRPNLTVATDTDALRLVFDGTRCAGVDLRQGDRKLTVHAARVVLCAGALNSPRLLMASGIGPAAALRALGIGVVHDAPEVGHNLREHRLLSLQFRLSHGSRNAAFRGAGLAASLARYYATRGGPLAQAAFELGGFVRVSPGDGPPDAQVGLAPLSLDKSTQRLAVEPHAGALCGGYAMRPDSAGTLALTGAAPEAPLEIRPNYLAAETDRRVSVGVVRLIRRLFARPELAGFAPAETFPGPGTERDDEILDAFHRHGQAGFHAAGTCRMGTDAGSVVDPATRVRGVHGLHVADISIMPRLVSGNTNAPAMAMARRAADLIDAAIAADAAAPA